MSLTELPFDLQGNIFRSPMPFGNYDPSGEAFQEFKQKNISTIVLLAEDQECEQKAGRNLREFYKQEGFRVIHFPIPDFGIPSKEDLEHFVQKTIECAKKGHNIVIHCSAGRGRTGLFAAYLAKQILGLSGEEAINWVRQYIDGAVETDEQKQLIIGDPNDEKEWINWGNSFRELERYEESLECYNKAIELNLNNENAWFMKGWSLNNIKRYEAALECYNKLIEIDPDDKITWWYLALSGFPNEEILKCYKKVIEINPDNKGAWWGNSLIYADMYRYEEALECYNKLIEIDPDDNDVWRKKGLSLLNLERYEEALECFNKLIKIDPNDGHAFENKGLSLLNLGYFEEALECFKKSIKIDLNNKYVWSEDDRCRFLRNLIEDVKTLKGYNKEIEINPNDENAWINKGLYLRRMGDRGSRQDPICDEAYDTGTVPFAINPRKYRSSLRNRRHEEALACFSKAFEITPKEKHWVIKGKTLGLWGGEEALECYNKAIEINPDDKEAWLLKGSVLRSMRRYEEALKCLNKAMEIDSNDIYTQKIAEEIKTLERDRLRQGTRKNNISGL